MDFRGVPVRQLKNVTKTRGEIGPPQAKNVTNFSFNNVSKASFGPSVHPAKIV